MPRMFCIAFVLLGLGLAGCAGLDPKADVASAANEVRERSGFSPGWDSPPAADGWDGRSPLSARQAVQLALRNNRTVRADLADIAAARADRTQAGLLPNPMLNAMFLFDGSGGSMISANAMQSISALWLRPSRTRGADAQLKQTVLRVADAALDLASRAEQSHRRLVSSQAVLVLLDRQQENFERALKAARDKFQAGLGTSLDINRVEAELLLNRVNRRSALLELEREKRRLLEMMGLAETGTAWTAEASPQPPERAGDEQAAVALARRQRLDLLAASWLVQARLHAVRQAQLGSLPEVSVGGGFERDSLGPDTMTTGGPGLTMSVPIFDQNQARIARADAETQRAMAEAQAADQKAVRQVREAFQSASAAREQARTYEQHVVPLAERNFQQAQRAFQAGEVDLLDVLMAERTLTQARLDLERQRLEADLAHSELARATGGLMTR